MKYKSDRIHCLVNGNDVVYDSHLKEIIKNMAGDIDIYLGSYTAAGPYPQTYFDLNDPKIRIEAEKIREKCLAIYESDINFFNAKINIPFAGKYMLGGRATELNQFLPVIDPIIVQRVDRNAVILSDAGGKINTFDFIPSKIRENEYTKEEILQRCKELSNKKMNYEKLFSENEIHQLPIKRLIRQAAKNAISKSEVLNDYFFAIQLPDNNFAVINASKNSSEEVLFTSDISNLTPRSEIYIDPRYLFGLLTHIYHWNNAEVGSNYRTRRFPNIFNRSVQNFLNFLTV